MKSNLKIFAEFSLQFLVMYKSEKNSLIYGKKLFCFQKIKNCYKILNFYFKMEFLHRHDLTQSVNYFL